MMFRSISALMIATSPAMADNWDVPMAWPDGNFITTSAGVFADEVRESTDGRVDITILPGGSLGCKGPENAGGSSRWPGADCRCVPAART